MRFATRRVPTALAAALAVGLGAAPAPAQTQAPPQPRQNRPGQPASPAPQQPPAPGQPAAGAQAAGPQVIQVKPEPSQIDWTKVCGKDQNSATEICYTTRDFIPDQGQPIFAVAIYDIKGPQTQKVVRFLLPLGLLLKPGIRFTIDQGQPTQRQRPEPGGARGDRSDPARRLRQGLRRPADRPEGAPGAAEEAPGGAGEAQRRASQAAGKQRRRRCCARRGWHAPGARCSGGGQPAAAVMVGM